jgi:hypothetical protein
MPSANLSGYNSHSAVTMGGRESEGGHDPAEYPGVPVEGPCKPEDYRHLPASREDARSTHQFKRRTEISVRLLKFYIFDSV